MTHLRTAGVARRQRWLARLAFASVVVAVAVLVVGGALRSITAVLLGAAGLALMCAAAWWFVARRGVLRWLAAVVLVAAPAGVITAYVLAGLLWDVALSGALAVTGVAAGRESLRDSQPRSGAGRSGRPRKVRRPRGGAARSGRARMDSRPRGGAGRSGRARTDSRPRGGLAGAGDGHLAVRPRRPFVIMNPRSGGGKVAACGLPGRAAARRADVALLAGPGTVDVAALARGAVDRDADLLGVAGGDGTQALVAGVAAARDVPMMVLAAGTRNHFALDLGLDRGDPASGLDALTDGVELRVDLGEICGGGAAGPGRRPFVNNASFGAYAQIVQSPAYRADKAGTALQLLPDLLSGHRGAHLVVRVDGRLVLDGPQAVLVSNNPYQTGDIAGLGRRDRLDRGVLGVVGVRIESGAQAAALLSGRSPGLTVTTGHEVVIDADTTHIPVGVDGESVLLPTPVRCTIRAGALRVLVPARRPGVPVPRPRLDWGRLRRLALASGRADRAAADQAAADHDAADQAAADRAAGDHDAADHDAADRAAVDETGRQ